MVPADIRVDCLTKGLIPPSEADLSHIFDEVFGGRFPSFWKATLTRENVKLRRWLRDMKVLHLWQRDVSVERAFDLLFRASVRKDFEAILLAHGDIERARRELTIKYPENLVPDESALRRYYDIFWNIGAMSREGLMEYITAEESREDYIPALQGDLITAYGTLGLQQRITSEKLLHNLVEMAYQQSDLMRKNPTIGGSAKMGAGVLIKIGLEAMDRLEERHVADAGDEDLRQAAADFMARMVHTERIPSIDELERGDVIDAEYAEAGKVHRLPVRRG